jgi:hypothetical protein
MVLYGLPKMYVLALPVWNTAVSTLFLKEDLEIIDIHLF